jgi:NADH:ubiquinone oxidoreductase subunit F (NADH-binding)/NADH:ubiquinone oxidoreductase subunit E
LQRRYERPGSEVLKRLRRVTHERGRVEAADVDRISAELELPRAHVNGAASFYSDLAPTSRGSRHVQVCAGTACFAAGGESGPRLLAERLGAPLGGISDDGGVSVQPAYCLGYCYGGPAALDGETAYAGPDLVEQLTGKAPRQDPEIPFRAEVPDPVVLAGLAGCGPDSWKVWAEVARTKARERVAREVAASRLRGRGGAGFPAAVKWGAASESESDGIRYLVCNGDEGDPGSFADRLLMERDPHRVLEGMALAAYAARANRGYVYVRSEYPRARDALLRAIEQARSAGHLSHDVHGSGVSFDIEVFEGAGSYVAGEETSLLHSIEGLRGDVGIRPPYPTEDGLLHRPTVVNNVETLCAVPWIVDRGGSAYASLGVGDSVGTKIVSLNERFQRPGAYEVELGVTLRHICDQLGGGLREGHELRAVQIGGPLGGYVTPDQLDTPLSFEALADIGVDLGHGSLIAIDERSSGPDLLRHAWRFAASESCGACAPCRIGCRRGLEVAEDIRGPDDRVPRSYEALLATMERGSLCAFGTSVPKAVRSLARAYPNELRD